MRKACPGAVDGLGTGLLAGALVGGIEVAWLVGHTGRLDLVGALAYAVLAYGLVGALVGLVCGLLFLCWRRPAHQPLVERVDCWPWCASLTVAVLLAPVAAYRLSTDWPRQQSGPVVAVGLALLVSLGVLFILRWLIRRSPGPKLLRWPGSLSLYGAVLLVAGVLSAAPTWLTEAANALAPPTGAPNPDNRPDVILIVADALRADRLSCYVHGAATNATPHIDALARDGVRYQDMSAQASWTKPSVATIFTSLYPSSHQALHAESQLPAATTTLAEALSAGGYRTIGLVTNAYITPLFGYDQGFDRYVYLEPDDPFFAPAAATRLTIHHALLRLYRQTDLERWQRQTLGTWPGPYYRPAGVVNQYLLSWLEARRGERFFLYVHYMDPHTPYFRHPYDGTAFVDALPPDQAPWVSRLYDGEVSYLDTQVGELFAALKRWGLYDEALIVFTADHGEEFFEHGGWGHGATLYEEQLRVPLIIKYPGNRYAGTIDEGLARSLDIAPTVLDVVGLPVPAAMQGVSLRPGENAPARATVAFAETIYQGQYPMQAVRVGARKLIRTAPGHPRLIPPTLLFDLAADPGEHHDQATTAPALVQALQADLDRIVAYAQTHAVAGSAGAIDPATRERLRNLGY